MDPLDDRRRQSGRQSPRRHRRGSSSPSGSERGERHRRERQKRRWAEADRGVDPVDGRRREEIEPGRDSGRRQDRESEGRRGYRRGRRGSRDSNDVRGRRSEEQAEDETGDRRRHGGEGRHSRRRNPDSRSPLARPKRVSVRERSPVRRRKSRSRSESGHGRRPRRHRHPSSSPSHSPAPSASQEPARRRTQAVEGDQDGKSRPPHPRRHQQHHHRPDNLTQPPLERRSRDTGLTRQPDPSDRHDAEEEEEAEKQKPNFDRTGRLAAETNSIGGVVLKYHEPAEARKPAGRDRWRLYVFKGSDLLDTVELGDRSCWLFGRERVVVDFPVDHPSCSKQHAVLQFRHVVKTNEYGDKDVRVRPYIIDLDSSNGTSVNGDRIPSTRYVELKNKDMIRFGSSTREYVLMLP